MSQLKRTHPHSPFSPPNRFIAYGKHEMDTQYCEERLRPDNITNNRIYNCTTALDCVADETRWKMWMWFDLVRKVYYLTALLLEVPKRYYYMK